VGLHRVVVLAPAFDDDPGFFQRVVERHSKLNYEYFVAVCSRKAEVGVSYPQ
jgi:hypothetical protein